MSILPRLLHNSALSFALNLVTKAANVIVFILTARLIGASQAGIFSLATTYLLIFSALTWGLDELMIRQVAHDHSTSARYFSAFLVMRCLVTIGLYVILAVAVWYGLRYPATTANPILILGLSLFPDSLGNVGQALLNAHERFEIPVGAALLASFIKLGGSIVALLSGAGLPGVGWAWCLGSSLGAMIVLTAAGRLAGRVHLAKWPDWSFWIHQIRTALPFLMVGFLITLEYQTDVVILSAFRNETEIGWYSAATTMTFALLLFPQAYRMAVYPLMVRYYQAGIDKLRRLYDLSFIYLGIAVLPMVVGINLLAPRIIELIYGPAFTGAVWPLRIIAWSLILNYLNVPNARLMLVSNRQNWLAAFLAVSMSLNIILNLMLDRSWGTIGAAFARLSSTLVFFLPNYLFVTRFILPHNFFRALARPTMAVIVMAIGVWWSQDMPLWISVPLGAVVYIIVLLALKGLPGDEQRWLMKMLQQPRT